MEVIHVRILLFLLSKHQQLPLLQVQVVEAQVVEVQVVALTFLIFAKQLRNNKPRSNHLNKIVSNQVSNLAHSRLVLRFQHNCQLKFQLRQVQVEALAK